jgi:hypothetical protein
MRINRIRNTNTLAVTRSAGLTAAKAQGHYPSAESIPTTSGRVILTGPPTLCRSEDPQGYAELKSAI